MTLLLGDSLRPRNWAPMLRQSEGTTRPVQDPRWANATRFANGFDQDLKNEGPSTANFDDSAHGGLQAQQAGALRALPRWGPAPANFQV